MSASRTAFFPKAPSPGHGRSGGPQRSATPAQSLQALWTGRDCFFMGAPCLLEPLPKRWSLLLLSRVHAKSLFSIVAEASILRI